MLIHICAKAPNSAYCIQACPIYDTRIAVIGIGIYRTFCHRHGTRNQPDARGNSYNTQRNRWLPFLHRVLYWICKNRLHFKRHLRLFHDLHESVQLRSCQWNLSPDIVSCVILIDILSTTGLKILHDIHKESRKWCTFLVKSRHMMVKCQLRTIRLILRICHKSCKFSYVF